MRSRIRAELGSVTAEFAAVIPAVVLVLIVALSAAQLAGEQLRLQSAVAEVARSVGRGGAEDSAPLRQVSGSATATVSGRGDLVCARGVAPVTFGILVGLTLSATSCALDDGA